MRRIFIGDVHGCYEQLCALLDAVELDRENDELIFLGDYIDRGPQSFEVVMLLKDLKDTMEERCILLRGNHENILAENDFELGNVNINTMRSFRRNENSFQDIEDSLRWLHDATQLMYRSPEVQAVHACLLNFMTDETYTDEQLEAWPDVIFWERNVLLDGEYNRLTTICGHTPYGDGPMWSHDGVVEPIADGPLRNHGLINIDTGCFFTGRLTALVLEDGQMRLISTGGKI